MNNVQKRVSYHGANVFYCKYMFFTGSICFLYQVYWQSQLSNASMAVCLYFCLHELTDLCYYLYNLETSSFALSYLFTMRR